MISSFSAFDPKKGSMVNGLTKRGCNINNTMISKQNVLANVTDEEDIQILAQSYVTYKIGLYFSFTYSFIE